VAARVTCEVPRAFEVSISSNISPVHSLVGIAAEPS
jgi:hypothetical protein